MTYLETNDMINDWISKIVNKNPELFDRDTIENLNYLRIMDRLDQAEAIVEMIIKENGGCGICGEVPMTTNCNNARCQDL
jgi:hypothetical protein